MAKKIAGLEIGKNYLVRCVTHYYTGKLLALTGGLVYVVVHFIAKVW